jgi:pimeloyl-ACP methyl ester carboxylesterase
MPQTRSSVIPKNSKIWDEVTHRWLRIPYTLHVHEDVRGAKKPRATILFIHGIGNSGAAWDEVIKQLPDDLRLVSIDLLGFGNSQSPAWAIYNVKTQARAILATYLKLRISGQVTIVGHSLGALVAVEIAKRYPLLVKSLILCSPPFYRDDEVKKRLFPESDQLLKTLYRRMVSRPEELLVVSRAAKRLGVVNRSFNLTKHNAASFTNALEASIINQTSLQDAVKLKTPTYVLYGQLDPVVIQKHLRYLAAHNPNVELQAVIAGHEVVGRFVQAVVQTITRTLDASTKASSGI